MFMSEAIQEFGFDCKIRKLSPKTIANYCGWQNYYISIMPEIYDDFYARFRSHPPTWLILPKEKETLPVFMDELLITDYCVYYENEKYTLYCSTYKLR